MIKDDGVNDFYRDAEGKIDDKRLSSYGKKELAKLQGAMLGFSDGVLTVKGDKLVDSHNHVVESIDNDRLINKIEFRLLTG